MIGKIRIVYDLLSKSDKMIADYFLEHKKEIINMSIQQVAEGAGTSSATVTRFVQKVFGCSFADTKIELARNMEIEEDKGTHFDWSLDYEQVPTALRNGMNSVFDDILRINKMDDFEEVSEVIARAENIYIFGIGVSGIVAQELTQRLVKLNKRAVYMIDSNFAVINSALCTPKDVVIAISNSGVTKEVLLPAKKAKQRGAKIIAVSGTVKNPLCDMSDYRIVIPNSEPRLMRLSSMYSRYGQFFAVDLLFVGTAKKLSDNPEEFLDLYRDVLKELK